MKIIMKRYLLYIGDDIGLIKLAIILLLGFFSLNTNAQVSGYVFRDLNANGKLDVIDIKEPAASSIKVKVTTITNTVFETTTDQDGKFSFSSTQVPPNTKVRINFSNFGEYSFAGPHGVDNQTSIQFATAPASSISFAVNYPSEYCNTTNPQVAIPCYLNGDPLQGGSAGNGVVMVMFPYLSSGVPSPTNVLPKALGKGSDIGSVWGMAYHRYEKKYLSSAILKRHAGLGPLGLGGIYWVDPFNQTSTPFIDVKNLGVDVGVMPARDLNANVTDKNIDSNVYPMIAKAGIGGIDFSEDYKTLYFVNLNNKKLYKLFIDYPVQTPTASNLTSFNIPNACGDASDMRPWAVKMYRGKVYVGTVCSAESSQATAQLSAVVYRFDPNTTTFTKVLDFPLNYKRGAIDNTPGCNLDHWLPWNNTFPSVCSGDFVVNSQPILSDLEFDVNGQMIIGLMDRFGHQSSMDSPNLQGEGHFNPFSAGDILRAKPNTNNTFSIENNAQSGDLLGCGENNNEGPGGGEFYCDDKWIFHGGVGHSENATGALAFLAGSNEVITTAYDPYSSPNNDIYWSNGWKVFNNTNGQSVRDLVIYDASYQGTFGKANGLGDMDLLCGPQPIEIGNRMWDDLNRNGIQDPAEPGVDGIILTLHDGSNGDVQVGTVTTENNGHFYFTDQNVTGGIKPFHNYKIRMSLDQPTVIAKNYAKTRSGADSGTPAKTVTPPAPAARIQNANARAFMEAENNSYIEIDVNTGGSGENSYDNDFGVYSVPTVTLVSDTVKVCGSAKSTLVSTVTHSIDTDSVRFVLFTSPPQNLQEKLTNGIVLGTVKPNELGIATLEATFPENYTLNPQSYTLCSILVADLPDTSNNNYDEGYSLTNPVPLALNAYNDSLTCTQRLARLSAITNQQNVVYSWKGPNGFVSNIKDTSVAIAGVYTLVVTSQLGCSSKEDSTVVIEHLDDPKLPLPFVSVCEPSNCVALPPIKTTQEWQNVLRNPTVLRIDTITNEACDIKNGEYWLLLREGICTSSDSMKITRFAKPMIGDTTISFCSSSPQLIDLSKIYSNYSTFIDPVWHLDSIAGAELTNLVIDPALGHSYYLYSKNESGCSDTTKVSFSDKSINLKFIALKSNSATCSKGIVDDNASIQVTGDFVGLKYDYQESGSFTKTTTFSTATSIPSDSLLVKNILASTTTKTFTVRFFNDGGCYKDVKIDVLPKVCDCNGKIVADTTIAVCTSNETTYDLSKVYTNYTSLVSPTWHVDSPTSAAMTNLVVDPRLPKNYYLIAYNTAGCADTSKVSFSDKSVNLKFIALKSNLATCTKGIVDDNASIQVTGDFVGLKYDYQESGSFTKATTFSTATSIPSDSLLVKNILASTSTKTFTVRFFNDGGCYKDVKIDIVPKVCDCNGKIVADTTITVCTSNETTYDLSKVYANYTSLVSPTWHVDTPTSAAMTNLVVDPKLPKNYYLIAYNTAGCADTSKVSFSDKSVNLQSLTLKTNLATCTGITVDNNASIQIDGDVTGIKYDYVVGGVFIKSTQFNTALAIPTDKLLVKNINTSIQALTYTVRIFNNSGCYKDLVVNFAQKSCVCKEICIPINIKKK